MPRVVLLVDHATGYTFQAAYQRRHRDSRRIVHQQMHMVNLAVELHELRFEVGADAGEDAAQVVEDSRW